MILSVVFTVTHRIITWIAVRLLGVAFISSVAYATGLAHRCLCILAEWHLSTLLNHTQVTIGCWTRIDIIRGVFAATNVVIHAPPTTNNNDTTTQSWKAPIVARMGRVYVEMNAWQWISCFVLKGGDDSTPLDFYTVHLSDIQVFVERSTSGTYNVLLLDPHLIVPPPTCTDTTTTTTTTTETNTTNKNTNNTTASVVLDDLLDAVGRAARAGTPDTLVSHYRQRLAEQQTVLDWRTALQQSVELCVHALPSSLASAATTTTLLQRKPGAPIVMGRVGLLRMEELRIFVPTTTTTTTNSEQEEEQQLLPLYVPSFVLKPMELAAAANYGSSSSSSSFSSLDDIWDVILKRLLAELATTQTGRLFQTAMHEMAQVLRAAQT